MWVNKFETEKGWISGEITARARFFYEPLTSKMPKAGVKPYCCYVNTVIFYAFPFQTKLFTNTFLEYGRCTTQWDMFGERFMEGEGWSCFAPLVLHEGQVYELGGGRVLRRKGQWCMEWLGWKVSVQDWRWPFIEKKMQEVTRE